MGDQTRENRPVPTGDGFRASLLLGRLGTKEVTLGNTSSHWTPAIKHSCLSPLGSDPAHAVSPSNTFYSFWELTIEDKTGRKRVAVATLLVHSVKVAIRRHKTTAIAQGGICWRGVIWSPIHFESPDTWKGYMWRKHSVYNVKLFPGHEHKSIRPSINPSIHPVIHPSIL